MSVPLTSRTGERAVNVLNHHNSLAFLSSCSEETSADLTGKVYQLEALLKQLHSDLQKVSFCIPVRSLGKRRPPGPDRGG